jgi:hypothetical protein
MTPAAPGRLPVRLRLPLLAAGALALIGGLYSALLLLGTPVPAPARPIEDVHGPVMVFGFVGTLIALERAVALGRRAGLLAPGASAGGALVLLVTGPALPGKVLMMAGAVGLLGIYRALWRRQPSVALLAQAAGAFAWYAATLLWLAGMSIAEVVPWMVAFVVATIGGERLELAHVALTSPSAQRWFLAALTALVGGATAASLWPRAGTQVFGLTLLAFTAWLAVFDVARHTARGTALPRYVAAGLLTGYAWLTLAALLWAGAGPTVTGARYDAVLHAVFLGFTMSMIFAHAPVILPAVLRRPLPYHRSLYLPLTLLHASLLMRIAVGDGAGAVPVWRWTGVANVVAVLLFLGVAVALSARARQVAVRS